MNLLIKAILIFSLFLFFNSNIVNAREFRVELPAFDLYGNQADEIINNVTYLEWLSDYFITTIGFRNHDTGQNRTDTPIIGEGIYYRIGNQRFWGESGIGLVLVYPKPEPIGSPVLYRIWFAGGISIGLFNIGFMYHHASNGDNIKVAGQDFNGSLADKNGGWDLINLSLGWKY